MQKIKHFGCSICVCLFTLGSGYLAADDTDIFFSQAAGSGETKPNVLIILDTSGSMQAYDTFTDSRLQRVKTAVDQLVSSDVDMNVGLMQFNGNNSGGPILMPVSDLETRHDELTDVVDALEPVGGTPTADALYEAALYMRGEGVDYGRKRGNDDVASNNRRSFRVSHADSYTGGTLVRPNGCNDNNLGTSACAEEEIIGNAVYTSPIAGSCQANHIVVLSDGNISSNASQDKIRSMTGASSCAESGNPACTTELVSWLNTTDQSSVFDGDQTITTSTIAFNVDGDGKEFLRRVAVAGGGTAYEAASSEELLTVFNNIASQVADVTSTLTSPATSVSQSNRLVNDSAVFFALFKPQLNARWDGNLKRFRLGLDNSGGGDVAIRDLNGNLAIDADTGGISSSSQSFWRETNDDGSVLAVADGSTVVRGGAANQLYLDGIDGIGERRVYTWVGDAGTAITAPVDLTAAAQQLNENNTALSDEVLGIAGVMPTAAEQNAYRQSLLQWARGVDVLDSDGDGSTIDIRRQLGDPLHSTPVQVNYATSAGSDNVQSIIYVGTNEGYLHAFDTSNGEEQFAFVPYELLPNLNTYYSDMSGLTRPYGLDGNITLWRDDADDDSVIENGESAYLFVGMRRGGSSYYALDITDPDSPKLAWTIKGGTGGTPGFEKLGQSWSRLSPVSMYIDGAHEDVLVFGGGYDTNQDPRADTEAAEQTADSTGNSLYIIRAETGELLWSGSGTRGGDELFADMDYGLNAPIRAIDTNRDDYVDQLYAADAGGQLWRFDVTQLHDGSEDLIQGGIIAQLSGANSADQRRFYNEPDVALVDDDSGRYLAINIGSGWRADPLDEVVDDRFYMIRQYAVYEAPEYYGKSVGSGRSSAIEESDLVNVSYTATPTTNEYGWMLELQDSGEKVLSTSVTFNNHVIFSTYVPAQQSDACEPELGSSFSYVLDVRSGAPVFDLDGSDSGSTDALTTSDRRVALNIEGIAPSASILFSEDAPDDPVVLFGTEQLDIDISNRTIRTFWADQGESGDF